MSSTLFNSFIRPILLSLLTIAGAYGAAIDIRSFGAMGNGTTDDTQAIQAAIDSCEDSGTVNFPAGNYLVRGLRLRSRCTYAGVGGATLTLLKTDHFLFDISETTNISITGLTFDGNGIGGGIIAERYAPTKQLLIAGCQFRNVSSSAHYPANLAIVSTWALLDAAIRDNRFSNIAGGIQLSTVQNVSITGNVFRDVTQGNAISIAPDAVSFQSGDNLRIAGNSGSGFARMAIELFEPHPSNGSVLTAPIIENNSFSIWTGTDGMGLSITHGKGAIVRGNRIGNASGPMQYTGIEVIVDNAQVAGNVVAGGFSFGIVVQGTSSPNIIGNTIVAAGDTGILLACSISFGRCASRNSVVTQNLIQNAHHTGIKLDNDWTGSRIGQNIITRSSGAWPDDAGLLFSGISQSPAPGPGYIDSNTVIHDSVANVPSFWFCGVRINSQMAGSTVRNNAVLSQAATPIGSGIVDNTGDATLGWIISGNQFINLAKPMN